MHSIILIFKPSMHDIMMGMIYFPLYKCTLSSIFTGNWLSSEKNAQAGYNGSVFGPTSLVINNECTGVDVNSQFPGGPGENRRIQASFLIFLLIERSDERHTSGF